MSSSEVSLHPLHCERSFESVLYAAFLTRSDAEIGGDEARMLLAGALAESVNKGRRQR